MFDQGKRWRAAMALWVAALACVHGPVQATTLAMPRVTVAPAAMSDDARYTTDWILRSRDNQALPFAIMDKKTARFFLFDEAGRLVGATPALMGAAPGDHAAPGVGSRPLSQIRPEERTTPAGRFVTEPGRNLAGEDIVWVDYDAALAIHRVRPGSSRERRNARLASPHVADHRVSLGCIVLPVAFYESVVRPVLGQRRGVVYVLPETRSARAMFGNLGRLAGAPVEGMAQPGQHRDSEGHGQREDEPRREGREEQEQAQAPAV